jgi:hypothetical protein
LEEEHRVSLVRDQRGRREFIAGTIKKSVPRYQVIGTSLRDEESGEYFPITKSIVDLFDSYGVEDTLSVFEDLGKGKVFNPAAVAAVVGRKKYGASKFAEMAAAGRRRKGKEEAGKKKPLTEKGKMRPGGGGRFAKLESEIASKNKSIEDSDLEKGRGPDIKTRKRRGSGKMGRFGIYIEDWKETEAQKEIRKEKEAGLEHQKEEAKNKYIEKSQDMQILSIDEALEKGRGPDKGPRKRRETGIRFASDLARQRTHKEVRAAVAEKYGEDWHKLPVGHETHQAGKNEFEKLYKEKYSGHLERVKKERPDLAVEKSQDMKILSIDEALEKGRGADKQKRKTKEGFGKFLKKAGRTQELKK